MALTYGYSGPSHFMDGPDYYDEDPNYLRPDQLDKVREYIDALITELYGNEDLDPYWIDECLTIIGDEIGLEVPKNLPTVLRKKQEPSTDLNLAAQLVRSFHETI